MSSPTMMPMSLTEIAQAVDGRLMPTTVPTDEPVAISAFTDSRQIVPGSVFVAIAGERVDGHDFVPKVGAQGAVAALVDHEIAGAQVGPDTLTRAMVWTIIARAEGVDTTGGATWYAKAQEWVTAKGISDGENPNAAITRQELVTMLYRLAGEPAVPSRKPGCRRWDGHLTFSGGRSRAANDPEPTSTVPISPP